MLVEAYFDESCTHAGSKTMALAGYLFRQDHSEQMADEWRAFLASKGLPFFHMVDCAHGNPPFENLSWQERTLVATRLIGLIKQHTVQGLGVTVDLESFNRRFGKTSFMGTPYSLGLWLILVGVSKWARETKYDGEIAYFFEAGHARQSEANELMGVFLRVPDLRATMRYAGHAFVDKAKVPQVQAADLLAWQLTKDRKNQAEGRKRRADYASLVQHPHNIGKATDKEFDVLEPRWNAQRQHIIGELEKRGIPIPGRPIAGVA